jgi:hypothetical protein
MTARRAALACSLAIGLAGCLSVPEGPAPMCTRNSDCNTSAGEVCQENVCWGDPPPGPFAAVAAPPSTRRDLVSRELPQIEIPPDGLLADIALETPAVLTGKVLAYCPPPTTGCDATLASTITVSRDSQFLGGPGFKATVDVDAGAESFSIPVPGGTSGGAAYSVTIVPSSDPSSGSGHSAAELAPPMRLELGLADTASTKTIVLGGPDLPVITGALTNSLDQGLAGYRVSALGRWVATESPTEVSSVDFTDSSGAYALTLSADLVGTIEIVARPPATMVAPTIHLASIDATKSSQQHNAVLPANLGNGTTVTIHVTGVDLSGAIADVAGAQVSIAGGMVSANGQAAFTLTDQEVTDDKGLVILSELDGAGIADSFAMSIIPPQSSTFGVVLNQKVTTTARLTSRVALRGVVVDSTGAPVANATVTARPSLKFLWTLEAAPQAFVAAIPAATAVTLDTGEFVLWVDPVVTSVASDYDLVIEPPTTARAPSYVKTDVAVQTSALDVPPLGISLGSIGLPDASFVHGHILGPDGVAIENAELRLYLIAASPAALCNELAHAPSSCSIPAQIQGRNTSDAKGMFRLTLAR